MTVVADAPAHGPRPGTHSLAHATRRLDEALAEFDLALDEGLPLPDLVLRDTEVRLACRAVEDLVEIPRRTA